MAGLIRNISEVKSMVARTGLDVHPLEIEARRRLRGVMSTNASVLSLRGSFDGH